MTYKVNFQPTKPELERRLRTARREVGMVDEYDYVVVNDEVDACVDRLRHIVLAERSRVAAMRDRIRPVVETFGAAAAPPAGQGGG